MLVGRNQSQLYGPFAINVMLIFQYIDGVPLYSASPHIYTVPQIHKSGPSGVTF